MAIVLRTPGQAARIYNRTDMPRQKNLFVVQFRTTQGSGGDVDWRNRLAFHVQSITRPQVQPVVEQVNQYNKKRQIQTGIKYGNCRMTLYETKENLAGRMWNDYARHYFGDFNQPFENAWRSDIVTQEFRSRMTSGPDREFGFSPKRDRSTSSDTASFFFDAVDVYEVESQHFIKYTLINPKISSYDPDGLDMTTSDISTVTLTLDFEAIHYYNQGIPSPASESGFLREVFCNGDLRSDGPTFPDIDLLPLRSRPVPPIESYYPVDVPGPVPIESARPVDLTSGIATPLPVSGGVGVGEGDFENFLASPLPSPSGANHQQYDRLVSLGGTSEYGNDYASDAMIGLAATQGLVEKQITRTDEGITLSPETIAAANVRKSPTAQIDIRDFTREFVGEIDSALVAVDDFAANIQRAALRRSARGFAQRDAAAVQSAINKEPQQPTLDEEVAQAGRQLTATGAAVGQYYADRVTELENRYKPR